MNAIVSIPPAFFYKEVKQEYSMCLSERVCLEALQNEIDAGATQIDINFSPENRQFQIKGNGHGMTKESLIAGLLTFGGSIKADGSRGGFGKAKFLLLFAQEGYVIRTHDNYVIGKGIEYDLTNCEYFDGTDIIITLPATWPNLENFPAAIRKVVSLSNLPCQIYYNGELLPQANPGTTPIETEYSIVRDNDKSDIVIRFGGLYMMSRPSPGDKSYFYDVKGDSRSCLTQNRENFRCDSPHYDAFYRFLNSLGQNKVQGLDGQMAAAQAPQDKIFNGVRYRGEIPDKMTKEHKTLFCLSAAIARVMGVRLDKSNLGFFFDNRLRGMCEGGGYIYLNPNVLIRDTWDAHAISAVIRTTLHEICHSYLKHGESIPNHSEDFALRLQEMWKEFWVKCTGISSLLEVARAYRKHFFPAVKIEKPQRQITHTLVNLGAIEMESEADCWS